ncbi:DUF2225 domain-containing protein [Peribacillus saganii]|uniref:DUF2225 domain-containing protein n=1 Tax=Peribacillus saganii TaxID=2303992 RepID=A0A372LPU0_9BACI|nr:DUF2225 domain-containing protein [Peribacillus saganii]RFU70134.1 DUF2225 domain-containing protein [Peribacillus saganii]
MDTIEPLFDRNIECLFCKGKFTTKKIRSRFIKVTSYDSDFCPYYASDDHNALLYNIYVCPHCGFSASDDFAKYFPPATKEMIAAKVHTNWVPQDFSGIRSIQEAIQTYKLASYCAVLKKEKHIVIAGLYLRIAWLNRKLENEDQEIRFMKLAINEYLESFSTDDFKGTQVSEVRLLYLIGDLYRRCGETDKSVKYFSMVIERKSTSIETKIIDMARERWQEIRDEKKLGESMSR